MRKFAVIVVLLVLMIMTSDLWIGKDDRLQDYYEVLKEQIESRPMAGYENKMYGYKMSYPPIFTQIETDGDDCVRFAFNDILLENRVTRIPSGQTFDESIDSIAKYSYADKISRGKDSFIISGPLYDDKGNKIDGFRYLSKYILRQKLWFAYTAYYPVAAESSLGRLFDTIRKWEAI